MCWRWMKTLRKLARTDKIKADLVQLRYFAGLTSDQAAHVLGISPATADRYWAYARAWLHQEIARARPPRADAARRKSGKKTANPWRLRGPGFRMEERGDFCSGSPRGAAMTEESIFAAALEKHTRSAERATHIWTPPVAAIASCAKPRGSPAEVPRRVRAAFCKGPLWKVDEPRRQATQGL